MAAHFESGHATEEELVVALLGRAVSTELPAPSGRRDASVVLLARGLGSAHLVSLDFEIRRGEVLGITGLVGSGHDDIPYLLYGTVPGSHGTVELDGHVYDRRNPEKSLDQGIGLLPANRQRAKRTSYKYVTGWS